MKTIFMALLAVSLVGGIAVIGITRMNASIPSAEATHETAVVILGCGPTEDHSTYLVDGYNGNEAASGLDRVVREGDSCTEALAALSNQGFNVVGMVGKASTYGDGFSYTLMFKNIPHVRDE